ncbi:MAG TPA: hypothetical protein VFG88_08915 [Nocardioidaceae bacterium]|jgi:hypothetical protein|nr:hypothetical protein [Nocardioidaceae bacterium]
MSPLALQLARLVDPAPDPSDVKPGWLAFGVFLLLAAAVVLLAFSLIKHLRRATRHFEADAGAAGGPGPGDQGDDGAPGDSQSADPGPRA